MVLYRRNTTVAYNHQHTSMATIQINQSTRCNNRPKHVAILFDIRKSVHHHTIQINQSTRCNSFTSLLLDVHVWCNMFQAPSRPSSGAYNCTRSLWFYRWRVAVAALLVWSGRLYLMMGRKAPGTCCTTHKRQIINL
jgi:hypothetical protein